MNIELTPKQYRTMRQALNDAKAEFDFQLNLPNNLKSEFIVQRYNQIEEALEISSAWKVKYIIKDS